MEMLISNKCFYLNTHTHLHTHRTCTQSSLKCVRTIQRQVYVLPKYNENRFFFSRCFCYISIRFVHLLRSRLLYHDILHSVFLVFGLCRRFLRVLKFLSFVTGKNETRSLSLFFVFPNFKNTSWSETEGDEDKWKRTKSQVPTTGNERCSIFGWCLLLCARLIFLVSCRVFVGRRRSSKWPLFFRFFEFADGVCMCVRVLRLLVLRHAVKFHSFYFLLPKCFDGMCWRWLMLLLFFQLCLSVCYRITKGT